MTESETVDKMIKELRDACKSDWQQAGYKQYIFQTFCDSPLNEYGVPRMSTDAWTSSIQNKLGKSSPEYKEIEFAMRAVAVAWNEWQYALKNSEKLGFTPPPCE